MTGCRCSMASPAWTIRTSWHRAPRSTRPAAGPRDSRDMSVMAEIGWQGLFTVAVIVVTLAMLLWERFSPDRVLVAAAGALMDSGVLTPAEALTGFWNPGVLTGAVLFVLVAALKTTGAIRWIEGGRAEGSTPDTNAH